MTRQPASGLTRRLLAAHAVVIAVGATTLAAVAVLAGPSLFRSHVRAALGPLSDSAAAHLDEAFARALLLSLGVAVLTAAVTALTVSWVVARRIARPVSRLADSAGRVAAGDYHTRVPVPSPDDELAHVTRSFNRMATVLEDSETTRRRLLADLAHELRTPLATLEGYVEGLDDGVVAAEPATWRTLADALARLRRLVDDLGVVSRAEQHPPDLELQQVGPGELVHQAVAAAQPLAQRRGVRLHADVTGRTAAVLVDVDRMGEALHNLLDNAVRHTGHGGDVTVTTDVDGGWVELVVADDGEGIDAADLPHVFERFYRADAARGDHHGGSGIGLTIVDAIVRAHGGSVHADSRGRGTGARFTIRLPTARAGRGLIGS
ncbi:MAG TPA: ATP-binding protein [Euzebyales bacterium]